MSAYFLAPVFFAFLGVIPIVILLYLLKLKRTQVVISSTMLWMKSLQDLTANAPFQRLRRNLLLLLQILILAALATALARPYVKAAGAQGKHTCVLIDSSGSMMTREGDGTRLDEAKAHALQMIDDMRMGDQMMIVSFNETSEVLCELTSDRFRLRQAVRNIHAVPTRTRIRDALVVAHSLKGSTQKNAIIPDLRVVAISDGDIGDLADIGPRGINMDFLQVGKTHDNAGIIAFSVRTPTEGQEGERQAFLLLHNERDKALDTTLTLTFQDRVVSVEEVAIPARQDKQVVFNIGTLGAGILKAHLDEDDALPVDNTAWLALRPASTIKVLLVADNDSTGAYFLKRVLLLEPRVELSSITPDNYVSADKYDLVIFDNYSPKELPNATLLFINAAPPLPDVSLGKEIDRPAIISTDSEHPMMRFLNPSTVSILKAHKLTVPGDARELVTTTGSPLIADVSRKGRKILVVAFDLADSNWPWHLSFPLFIQNLLAWVPRSQLSDETHVATGKPLTIMPGQDVSKAVVTLPDGSSENVELDPTRPSFFGDTDQVGVYLVSRGKESEQFAVDLLDARESAIAPANELNMGRVQVAAVKGNVKQNKEIWHWFVIAALAILMLEWFIYTRRAWL